MSEQKYPHDFIGLCQAVGFVVINWGLIENQIDNWVSVTFNQGGGKSLRKNQDIPVSLKQKNIYLRQCLRKLSALASFKDEGLQLIQRVSDISPHRDRLVHGTITSIHPENGSFRYRIIGYEKERHTIRKFEFTLDEFAKLENSLSHLLTDTIRYSDRLGSAFLS